MIDRASAISFSGLIEQYNDIKDEIIPAIGRVLDSGWYILGKELKDFEEEFAQFCGSRYTVGCASGTEAIALSLMALDIGIGDEVITVPNTAVPTVSAISMTGAIPVFVDINDDCLIDPKKIEKAVTERTRAIIPVHLYGRMADMDEILKIAGSYKLKVVEDACQAHGAGYNGKMAGTLGDTGCFSFYPTKNLGCFGDGGAVITNNKEIYDRLIMRRNYGQADRYLNKIKGINSRLDEIQAAVLRVKLRCLAKWNEQRRNIAHIYDMQLKDVCIRPVEREGCYDVFHIYVIRVKNRDKLQLYLKENGIDTLIHYPIPVHLQEAYRFLHYKVGDFPTAEQLSKEILSLPIHPYLSSDNMEYICGKILEYNEKK